jgi:GH43 family beta-xylosidase
MKKSSLRIISCVLVLLMILSSCGPEKSKQYLVENEDYIDLSSQYDGKNIEYDESIWYMNNLKDVPLPDPYVYVEDDTYYIVGTSDRNPDAVDCYVTTDFVNYTLHKEIYNPTLYKGWEDRKEALVFAPEIYCFDGVYYMYYSAKDKNLKRRCSVVVADNPLGPYKPLVNDEVDGLSAPLLHNADYVKRALDATVFTDDDGKMYMYFTVTQKSQNITDVDTQHIVGVELISPYQADWSTYKELIIPGTIDAESEDQLIEWELYRDNKVQINEAPFMIKSNGKYYLTYSCNGAWNKYYNVCYAVSDSPLGNFVKPYEEGKTWTNLLMGFPGTNDEEALVYKQWSGFASGTGHHCFFYSGDELMIGYHAHQNRDWNSKDYTIRYFAFDYVYFDKNGVPFVNGPTYSAINLPERINGFKNIVQGAKITVNNIQNVQNLNDNYIVDTYNLDVKENEVILGTGESYIEIEFNKLYEIYGVLVYNSAYYDSYIVEIEYIDFGNGNIIYYPQFCEDFYVNHETEFVRPLRCFNLEIINTFKADRVKIGFDLPDGGAINEIVSLGK